VSFKLIGDPGDIAVEAINISKNPKDKLPLQRAFIVRRMTLSGEWVEIGVYAEYFGPDPEDPDSMAYMFESPSGMIYQETWFTQEEQERVFHKVFMNCRPSVDIVAFLLQHYKDQPIAK
jgi:hypothetical protein